MSLTDLLRRKNLIIIHLSQLSAIQRLQKWWRKRLRAKKAAYGPSSIYEVKRMLDKVCIIQSWYRRLKVVWASRDTLAKKVAAALIIQAQARKLLERIQLRKISDMKDSFVFFGALRSRCILDSQIKLAYLWKKIKKLRIKRAEEARLEEERIKAEKLARKNKKKKGYGQVKRAKKKKKKVNTDLDEAGGVDKDQSPTPDAVEETKEADQADEYDSEAEKDE